MRTFYSTYKTIVCHLDWRQIFLLSEKKDQMCIKKRGWTLLWSVTPFNMTLRPSFNDQWNFIGHPELLQNNTWGQLQSRERRACFQALLAREGCDVFDDVWKPFILISQFSGLGEGIITPTLPFTQINCFTVSNGELIGLMPQMFTPSFFRTDVQPPPQRNPAMSPVSITARSNSDENNTVDTPTTGTEKEISLSKLQIPDSSFESDEKREKARKAAKYLKLIVHCQVCTSSLTSDLSSPFHALLHVASLFILFYISFTSLMTTHFSFTALQWQVQNPCLQEHSSSTKPLRALSEPWEVSHQGMLPDQEITMSYDRMSLWAQASKKGWLGAQVLQPLFFCGHRQCRRWWSTTG